MSLTTSSPQTTTPVSGDPRHEPLSPMDITVIPVKELLIPKFAESVARPLSMKEDLTALPRKPRGPPLSTLLSSLVTSPETSVPSSAIDLYLVHNVSHRFTDRSLRAFLGTERASFIQYRILSVNENRGRFDPPLLAQQILSVPGLVVTRSSPGRALTHMIAYGEKSVCEPMDSLERVTNSVLSQIYQTLSKQFSPHNSAEPVSSKFGGGLGRKSASGHQVARYGIRARNGLMSEDEWRSRGAVSVEANDRYTVAKFARIELRDAACDSFIVGIELGVSQKFEVAVSSVSGEVVQFENSDAPGVPEQRVLDPEILFPSVVRR